MSGRQYTAPIPLVCPDCGERLGLPAALADDATKVSAACVNPDCPTKAVVTTVLDHDQPSVLANAAFNRVKYMVPTEL